MQAWGWELALPGRLARGCGVKDLWAEVRARGTRKMSWRKVRIGGQWGAVSPGRAKNWQDPTRQPRP